MAVVREAFRLLVPGIALLDSRRRAALGGNEVGALERPTSG